MPRFADGFVNELKDRIDLFDLTNRYVQLKKSGSSWVGLSPFNQEKTPSFYIHPEKGFFNCFSSGEKGDVITFIQKMENLSFQEAIEFLAQEFSIPLRYQKGGATQPFSNSIKSELYSLHELVTSWFCEQFSTQKKESSIARNYWLEERKFSLLTAQRFQIGFAPTNPKALIEFLMVKKISRLVIEKSGLFRSNEKTGEFFPIFSGRLMIPIREKLGRICGFTGRKLSLTPEWGDKKSPKYINSPETPIYKKGQLLFNLDLANKEISSESDFLLVEGQLDAIRCWEEGFRTVVAPQGTAFKELQADLLRKSNPRRVVCLLDGDDAGKKAALSYIPIFLQAGLDARFATLPTGVDPDQILINKGADALKEIIEGGKNMIDYAVGQKLNKEKRISPNERKQLSEFIFEPLSKLESFVVKDSYLEEMAKSLSMSYDSIKRDYLRFANEAKNRRKYKIISEKKEVSTKPQRLTIVEDDLLYAVLHDDRLASPLAQILDLALLDLESTSGRILAKILSEVRAEGFSSINQLEELLENDRERSTFQRFLFLDASSHEDIFLPQLVNQCLSVLHFRQTKRFEQSILEQIKDCVDDADKIKALRSQLKKIRSNRNSPPVLILSE